MRTHTYKCMHIAICPYTVNSIYIPTCTCVSPLSHVLTPGEYWTTTVAGITEVILAFCPNAILAACATIITLHSEYTYMYTYCRITAQQCTGT